MSVHIERDGAYVVCESGSCTLPIHLPLDTVEEARALPYSALLTLIEAFDPPTEINRSRGWRAWVKPGARRRHYYHREYDLPALIHDDGQMEWFREGNPFRGNDKPTTILSDGEMWWENEKEGDFHRLGGKPAVVCPNGTVEYWIDGVQVDEKGERL